MRNFLRAVRLALKYRFTLLGIVCSSLMVGLLWGGSISTVYPFVEVVFRGDSMHEWVDDRIQQSERKSAEMRATIIRLEREQAGAVSSGRREQLGRQIAVEQSRLDCEQKALATARWLQGPIHHYLPSDAFQTLLAVMAFVMVGTLLKGVFVVANVMLVTRLAQTAAVELRKQLYHHTLKLELAAFAKDRTGQLMSRFTADLGAVTGGVTVLFGTTLREPFKMVACLVGAALVSWQLLLLSVFVVPLGFLLTCWLARWIKRANGRVLAETARLYNRLAESFAAIQLIKAFTMERFEHGRFHQNSQDLYRKTMRVTLFGSLTKVNIELFGMGVICLSILAGGYLVLSQQPHLFGIRMTDRPLSFGALMLFYAFLIGANDPVRKLSDVFSQLQYAAAAADRVFPALEREPAIIDPAHPRRLADARRDLVFDRVHFHYVPEQPVLQDVGLRIPFGQSLAIVGPNGCGKSTLVNLIPRFYDPVEGAVRLGGVDLRELRLYELRKNIGVVTQQTLLFDDTVMNNIRYGSPGATDEEVVEAARKAQAHRFIVEELEDGYQTNVGERGSRLSGGQRQRIALARAILRDPSILILDEATSQIDPESEQLIHQALRQFIRGRTAVMISHRVSTLTLADRILVLDAGRVADIGTHDELIARCGRYRRKYRTDFRASA